jgi:integrase
MLKEFENLISFPVQPIDLIIDLNGFSSPIFENEELSNLLLFFRHRNHTHYLIMKFLLSTGVSIPDLIYFQIKNIDFERGMLTMIERKRLNFREIPLEKGFLRELFRHCIDQSKESPLFQGRHGCFRDERSIQKILNTAALFLKKEINIPIIRDSLAVSFFNRGVPIQDIQIFLGHRSIKSTRQRISSCQKRIEKQMGHNFNDWKEKAA